MKIESEKDLLDVLTRPSDQLIEYISTLSGPLLVLGAGGKMGPTLCVRAHRAAKQASVPLDVIAVSRFSSPEKREWLESEGVQTIACDLMNRAEIAALPGAENIIYLVGMKFGTQNNPSLTWAVNTLTPAMVSERYPEARIVALSTGNVYPFIPVQKGGSVEGDVLTPLGEYANACVARERIFEYYTQVSSTQAVNVRLNYAIDLRYGVLVDLANQISRGEPIDLTMGYFNCIWQGDANDMIIRALDLAESPARALNLTGPETLQVRSVAKQLGRLLGKEVRFTGQETPTALLNNSTLAHLLLGAPEISIEQMIHRVADWVNRDLPTMQKPTHFQVRDGQY